jgi:hypothetical protein
VSALLGNRYGTGRIGGGGGGGVKNKFFPSRYLAEESGMAKMQLKYINALHPMETFAIA